MRFKQLLNHYFNHFTLDPTLMSDIPREQSEHFLKFFFTDRLEVIKQQIGDQGETIKTLYKLRDGNFIESVLMFYPDRATLCISSQVGCAMGCPFCATSQLGLSRNLTAFEILEQVRLAANDCTQKGKRFTNIVFMGEGEPTQNLDNLFLALDFICAQGNQNAQDVQSSQYAKVCKSMQKYAKTPQKYSFKIPARNITISTVGNVEGIEKLAQNPKSFRLAISLHAATDVLRDQLVPMNKKYPIDSVLDAGFAYFKAKNRRISIEYALMKDVNDTQKQAFTLAKLLNRRGTGWAHVNLIPLNEVKGSKWTKSTDQSTADFIKALESKGIAVTLRESRGQDIDGACGQLALKQS